jgi:hypothetical protein
MLEGGVAAHGFKLLGGGDLASELDFEVTAKFGDHWSAGIKHADFTY